MSRIYFKKNIEQTVNFDVLFLKLNNNKTKLLYIKLEN